jgi:hypothetical protein
MEYFLLYDASFQLECYDLSVPQLPHLAATIPLPACLLYLVPLLHLGKANAYSHNRVHSKARRWRFPLAFRDDQLHSLAPLFLLRIVAIAHTHETITILREQLLRAFLPRFEIHNIVHITPQAITLPRAAQAQGGAVGFFVSLLLLRFFLSALGRRTLSRYPKGSDNCLLPRHIIHRTARTVMGYKACLLKHWGAFCGYSALVKVSQYETSYGQVPFNAFCTSSERL